LQAGQTSFVAMFICGRTRSRVICINPNLDNGRTVGLRLVVRHLVLHDFINEFLIVWILHVNEVLPQ
jgi:hypothetical protein